MPIVLFLVLVSSAFFVGTWMVNLPAHQQSENSPSPIIEQTPTEFPKPTFIPTPKVKGTNIKPIITPTSQLVFIDCYLPTPDGQGKVIKATKQQCEDGLRRIEEAKRQAEERNKQFEGMVRCNLSFGDFGIMKKEECQKLVDEQVKKGLHEKTLRDAEQELRLQGLTPDEIDAELYRLDQQLKEQGL